MGASSPAADGQPVRSRLLSSTQNIAHGDGKMIHNCYLLSQVHPKGAGTPHINPLKKKLSVLNMLLTLGRE